VTAIPILGQGPKPTPVEQLSALLDTLCDTLAAAKVAADQTLPGSQLAKAIARADTLKAEISPVLAGALDQVKAGERRRNREAVLKIIEEKKTTAEIEYADPTLEHMPVHSAPQLLKEAADEVSLALGGLPAEPGARA
jgi:hypothetical protein